jgi:hypothetical protein
VTYPVGVVNSAEPSGIGPTGPNDLPGYTEIYSTDFTGNTLTTDWDPYSGQPGGDPGALFAEDHVSESGGVLSINTYQDPDFSDQWVTGGTCLCGIPGQTYGAYFVRSRVTGPGDDDAEILWPDADVWPPEIDFNETGGPTTSTSATIHWGPNGQNNQEQRFATIDMTQWHTWGIIWTPTSVTYTVDGAVWGTITTASEIPNIPMHITLQSQTFCSAGWACPSSDQSMLVDWVTEYSPDATTPTPTTSPTTTTTAATPPTVPGPPVTTTTQPTPTTPPVGVPPVTTTATSPKIPSTTGSVRSRSGDSASLHWTSRGSKGITRANVYLFKGRGCRTPIGQSGATYRASSDVTSGTVTLKGRDYSSGTYSAFVQVVGTSGSHRSSCFTL